METRYYLHKSPWDTYSSLAEVEGTEAKITFTIKKSETLWGRSNYDIRVPKDSSCLFTDKALAVNALRKALTQQAARARESLREVDEVLEQLEVEYGNL
jgi:hypothetical protein